MDEIILLIKKIISTIERFVAGHENELVYGAIASSIATIFAFFFKKIRIFFLFLIKSIFNLLRTKHGKLASIQIEGASIIDTNYITYVKTIGKKQKYRVGDFYLAKQYEFCQWYGILNNWDIERDAYKKIKEEVDNSFADEFRQPKIIALIYGRGGSGKSTLLRRLAVDCLNEDYFILWINDKEITKFSENGVNQLGFYSNTKFLILIEDWYRIKQNTENANEIINSICSYSNVRVIIGDRTIDNSISKEHIYNLDDNIIELSVNENEKTITRILSKIPQWKSTAESLLTEDNDYKSSLYLILWVIARTYQSKNKIFDDNKIKREGLTGHFQTIVESDLRAISKHYPGLAKMLYYWGSVYSERKTYLGFDVFIKLADLFKGESYESKLAFSSKEIKPILDIYINKATGLIKLAGQIPLVVFNHDILADEGLSKVQINGWHKFDNSIKLQMLPLLINDGDDFSASIFLVYTYNSIDKESFSDQERFFYLKKLFEKRNKGNYLNFLFNNKIEINETEKRKFAIEILNDYSNYEYNVGLICICLHLLQNFPEGKKTTAAILSQHDFFKLSHQIVSTAMNISKDKTERQKAATTILSQPDFFKLPSGIVSTAMKISKDEKERQRAATVILSQSDFFKLPSGIVSTAMKILKDEKERQKAVTAILSHPDFIKLPSEVVSTAMKISKDEKEQQKAATSILSHPDLIKLSFEIVSTAMNISNDETGRQNAASTILAQHDFFNLPHQLVSTAMKISKDETERQKAAAAILAQPDFIKLPSEVVFTAMKISNSEEERQRAATSILSQPEFFKLSHNIVSIAIKISKDKEQAAYVLRNWGKIDWRIVFQSLYCIANNSSHRQHVNDIVNSIINNKSKGGVYYFRFCQLLKIPLHGISVWENECRRIINNNSQNSSLVNNVLLSHLLFPNKIKKICEVVLREWKLEIVKPIKQLYGDPNYGDNIKIALGHPYLNALAKETAKEIYDAESKKQGSIPKNLLDIVNSIINDDIFPEWNLEADNN